MGNSLSSLTSRCVRSRPFACVGSTGAASLYFAGAPRAA